jgi:hypothetical protein
MPEITRAQAQALVSRSDLLSAECHAKTVQRLNWHGRLSRLEGYGVSGGSAGDRKLIVEALASLEGQVR